MPNASKQKLPQESCVFPRTATVGLTYIYALSCPIIFCFYIVLMKYIIYISNNLATTNVHWRFTPDLSSVYVYVWDVHEGKNILGRTVVQIVADLLLMKHWFDNGPVLVGFVVAEVTIRQFSLTGFRVSLVSISPQTLHTHSFIYHPNCKMIFSQYIRYSLSVSFHQCSILIPSSTTHAVKCFSPSTSVSPVSIIQPMLHSHSFIYHPSSIKFFSQHFSFPCQYHSTNAPYSFPHLQPTL